MSFHHLLQRLTKGKTRAPQDPPPPQPRYAFWTYICELHLKGEFHGLAHARILTGLCTLSGTGPGFSLFMNQSWASYLILHANSPKIINRRINCTGQQLNSTVHSVGKICWNPLRILVIRLLPRLTIASDYWTTPQRGFWSDKID